jgi:hypothetical protein
MTLITGNQRQTCINKATHPNYRYSISCSGNITDDSNDTDNQISPVDDQISESTCAFCKNNFEGTQLDKLSVYPICDACKTNLNKKVLPLWVKLFFTGVLILVAFSIFWNWRFYSAYLNIKKANIAAGDRNISKAAALMAKASEQVPEIHNIAEMASYYKGIDLLNKDRSTEAVTAFSNCKNLPTDLRVNELSLQAEMGSGFDKKNYRLFLTSAKEFLLLDTTQAQSWAGVASAYSCLYAENNIDSLKQQSLKYFYKAKALDDTSADAKEYYGRILYRLDTRQIITKNQFDQKYPKGYISNH